MKRSYFSFAFALLASVGAAEASAQGMDMNVRCLLVSNAFANAAKDAKAKEVANAAKLFYGGRVSTLPGAQLQASLLAQQKQISPANVGTTMTACAQNMDRALKTIQAAGQRIQQSRR